MKPPYRYFEGYSNAEFRQAAKAEADAPEKSLGFYARLRKANRERYLDLLAVSVFCPVVASIVAYQATRVLLWDRTIVVLLILSLVGYCPAIVIYGRRVFGLRFQHPGLVGKRYAKQQY